MPFFKDVAVYAALNASGVHDALGNKDADNMYRSFKNMVPKQVRKHLNADDTASIVLRLCGLDFIQSTHLTLKGKILKHQPLDDTAQMVLVTLVEFANAEIEVNAA